MTHKKAWPIGTPKINQKNSQNQIANFLDVISSSSVTKRNS